MSLYLLNDSELYIFIGTHRMRLAFFGMHSSTIRMGQPFHLGQEHSDEK
jgi:hypothetical protein